MGRFVKNHLGQDVYVPSPGERGHYDFWYKTKKVNPLNTVFSPVRPEDLAAPIPGMGVVPDIEREQPVIYDRENLQFENLMLTEEENERMRQMERTRRLREQQGLPVSDRPFMQVNPTRPEDTFMGRVVDPNRAQERQQIGQETDSRVHKENEKYRQNRSRKDAMLNSPEAREMVRKIQQGLADEEEFKANWVKDKTHAWDVSIEGDAYQELWAQLNQDSTLAKKAGEFLGKTVEDPDRTAVGSEIRDEFYAKLEQEHNQRELEKETRLENRHMPGHSAPIEYAPKPFDPYSRESREEVKDRIGQFVVSNRVEEQIANLEQLTKDLANAETARSQASTGFGPGSMFGTPELAYEEDLIIKTNQAQREWRKLQDQIHKHLDDPFLADKTKRQFVSLLHKSGKRLVEADVNSRYEIRLKEKVNTLASTDYWKNLERRKGRKLSNEERVQYLRNTDTPMELFLEEQTHKQLSKHRKSAALKSIQNSLPFKILSPLGSTDTGFQVLLAVSDGITGLLKIPVSVGAAAGMPGFTKTGGELSDFLEDHANAVDIYTTKTLGDGRSLKTLGLNPHQFRGVVTSIYQSMVLGGFGLGHGGVATGFGLTTFADEYQRGIDEGLSRGTASLYAGIQGVFEGGIEYALPGTNKWAANLMTRGILNQSAKKSLKIVAPTIKKRVFDFAKTIGQEQASEALTTITQLFTEGSFIHEDKNFFSENIGPALLETVETVFAQTMLMGGGGNLVSGRNRRLKATISERYRRYQERLDRMYGKLAPLTDQIRTSGSLSDRMAEVINRISPAGAAQLRKLREQGKQISRTAIEKLYGPEIAGRLTKLEQREAFADAILGQKQRVQQEVIDNSPVLQESPTKVVEVEDQQTGEKNVVTVNVEQGQTAQEAVDEQVRTATGEAPVVVTEPDTESLGIRDPESIMEEIKGLKDSIINPETTPAERETFEKRKTVLEQVLNKRLRDRKKETPETPTEAPAAAWFAPQRVEAPQYDEDGFDQEGYDSSSFDIEGFSRSGVDKYGVTKDGRITTPEWEHWHPSDRPDYYDPDALGQYPQAKTRTLEQAEIDLKELEDAKKRHDIHNEKLKKQGRGAELLIKENPWPPFIEKLKKQIAIAKRRRGDIAEAPTEAAPETAGLGVSPIVGDMLGALGKSLEQIRERVSNVKQGPIRNGVETFTFEFDGNEYEGRQEGVLRDVVVGASPEADAKIGSTALVQKLAKLIGKPTPTEAAEGTVQMLGGRNSSEVWTSPELAAKAREAGYVENEGRTPQEGDTLEDAVNGLVLNEQQQVLWKELLPILQSQEKGVPRFYVKEIEEGAADYEPISHVIRLDPSKSKHKVAHSLLHEAIHAATRDLVLASTAHLYQGNRKEGISERSLDAMGRLGAVAYWVKQNRPDRLEGETVSEYRNRTYGTRNTMELVAEAFTNPQFQRWLSTVKVPRSTKYADLRGKTLLQSFIDGVKRLLNIRSKKAVTALEEVLGLSHTVMEEDARRSAPSSTEATPAEKQQQKADEAWKEAGREATDFLGGGMAFAKKGESRREAFDRMTDKIATALVEQAKATGLKLAELAKKWYAENSKGKTAKQKTELKKLASSALLSANQRLKTDEKLKALNKEYEDGQDQTVNLSFGLPVIPQGLQDSVLAALRESWSLVNKTYLHYADIIEKTAGNTGKRIAVTMRNAARLVGKNMGQLQPSLIAAHKAFNKRVSKRSLESVVSRLQKVQINDKGWGVARIVDLVEGRIEPENAAEKEAVDAIRKLNLETGEILKSVGLLQKTQKGETVKFDVTPEGKVYLRLATEDLRTILLHPEHNSAEFNSVVKAFAEANGIKESQVRAIFAEMRERLTDINKLASHSHIGPELQRALKVVPTHIDHNGEVIPLFQTNPHLYVESVASSTAHRAAFVQHFGQDGAIARKLREILNKANGDVKMFDQMLRGISGLPPNPTEFFLKNQKVRRGARIYAATLGVAKASAMSAAAAVNIPESLGTTVSHVGLRPYLRSMIRSLFPHKSLTAKEIELFKFMGVSEAELADKKNHAKLYSRVAQEVMVELLLRTNAMTKDVMMWSIDKDNVTASLLNRLGGVINRATFVHFVNEKQEQRAGLTALSLFADILDRAKKGQKPRGTDIWLFRDAGFSNTVADKLAAGTATPQQYKDALRAIVDHLVSTVGTKAEKSPYSQTRLWKANVSFMTFFLGEARRSAKLFDNVIKAENRKMRLAAAARLGKWAFGKTVSGTIASYIVALTYSELGDDEWWEEVKRDPLWALLNAWYTSVVGGIFATAGLTISNLFKTGDVDKSIIDGLKGVTFQGSLAVEAVMLLMDSGQYRKKTFGDFAMNRVSLSKRGVPLSVIISLGNIIGQDGKFKSPELRTAERSYWEWKSKNKPTTGGSRGSVEEEKKKFYMALNRASILYLDGKTEKADAIVNEIIYAGDATYKDKKDRRTKVRTYLSRQQRIRSLSDEQKESLKKWMSPRAYELLEAWDEAIEGLKPKTRTEYTPE